MYWAISVRPLIPTPPRRRRRNCATNCVTRVLQEARIPALWAYPGGAMVEGTGFEPVYAKRSDLQSDGFNHSPTPPLQRRLGRKRSAIARRRGGLWWADDSVSTPLCQTTPDFQAKFAAKMPGMCKKLRDHPDPFPQGVAFNGELALMPVASVTDRAGIAQW